MRIVEYIITILLCTTNIVLGQGKLEIELEYNSSDNYSGWGVLDLRITNNSGPTYIFDDCLVEVTSYTSGVGSTTTMGAPKPCTKTNWTTIEHDSTYEFTIILLDCSDNVNCDSLIKVSIPIFKELQFQSQLEIPQNCWKNLGNRINLKISRHGIKSKTTWEETSNMTWETCKYGCND